MGLTVAMLALLVAGAAVCWFSCDRSTTMARSRGGKTKAGDDSAVQERGIVISSDDLIVEGPASADVHGLCELRVSFAGKLRAFESLPATQVHDAYDADRDGIFVRLSARFTHEGGEELTVPGFALKEKPGGDWKWQVRFSPHLAGEWRATVNLQGRATAGGPGISAETKIGSPITAVARPGITGRLVAPGPGENPRYLRQLTLGGKSEAVWLFGACRAWVVERQNEHNDWYPHEWLDRESELLAPMREGGFNLLNQWMAPWEFLIVHHDRAEHWRDPTGGFRRTPIPEGEQWNPHQCYDQGRAAAFDDLVRLCEGGPDKSTVHLLLSPLPHQCLQLAEHPWGAQESGWSPANDAGKQTLERLNGFSAFRPGMEVWEFFQADPSEAVGDWRCRLFDHEANYLRHLIARWGYSRALGVWVLVDELDAVGNEVGDRAHRRGWWAHPECDRWLANVVRLFRGRMKRSDGLAYDGDPYGHPLHAATTSFGGQSNRGGNIDWQGGPPDARPDLFGFHWYPYWDHGASWTDIWLYTIDGVTSYARAPIGEVPRLISEFGAADRRRPEDDASKLYPTLFHHSAWAAVFSGQAGTPMDWDDGKQFGELRWRSRDGIFSRKNYPIDHVEQILALRRFLGETSPEDLAWCGERDARVKIEPEGEAHVHALCETRRGGRVCGWIFSRGEGARFSVSGLAPGEYALTWYDPWTGRRVPGAASRLKVDGTGTAKVVADDVMTALRTAAEGFPSTTRLDRGKDAAFKIEAVLAP